MYNTAAMITTLVPLDIWGAMSFSCAAPKGAKTRFYTKYTRPRRRCRQCGHYTSRARRACRTSHPHLRFRLRRRHRSSFFFFFAQSRTSRCGSGQCYAMRARLLVSCTFRGMGMNIKENGAQCDVRVAAPPPHSHVLLKNLRASRQRMSTRRRRRRRRRRTFGQRE